MRLGTPAPTGRGRRAGGPLDSPRLRCRRRAAVCAPSRSRPGGSERRRRVGPEPGSPAVPVRPGYPDRWREGSEVPAPPVTSGVGMVPIPNCRSTGSEPTHLTFIGRARSVDCRYDAGGLSGLAHDTVLELSAGNCGAWLPTCTPPPVASCT